MRKITTNKQAQSGPSEWINSTNHPSVVPLREQLDQVVEGIKALQQSIASRVDMGNDMDAEKAWDAMDKAIKHAVETKGWLEDAGWNLTPPDPV